MKILVRARKDHIAFKASAQHTDNLQEAQGEENMSGSEGHWWALVWRRKAQCPFIHLHSPRAQKGGQTAPQERSTGPRTIRWQGPICSSHSCGRLNKKGGKTLWKKEKRTAPTKPRERASRPYVYQLLAAWTWTRYLNFVTFSFCKY